LIAYILSWPASSWQLPAVWAIAAIFTLLLSAFVLFALRFTLVLIDKNYADTLCIMTSIYTLLELSRDDVLAHPWRKRLLLRRIRDLARCTLLISLSIGSSTQANKNWSRDHFRQIEQYIREREKWVIAPTASTLATIRRDFYYLADLFISGEYGRFPWQETRQATTAETAGVPPTRLQQLRMGLPGFIAISLPVVGFGVLWLYPAVFERVGLEANTVALILLAWLLLAIDVVLKLGIVSSIIQLARDFKDLT
jgi:hypothetical protein